MSEARRKFWLDSGRVVVFSDAHYWPGPASTAHRALCRLLPTLDPALVVANGDIFDGARISTHARIGWNHAPKPAEELEACKERMAEIVAACPSAQTVWPLGNHDARFETYLANHAGEMAGVPGFTLREHFPEWMPCWSVQINDDTIIKHRWKGGKNATLKNVLEAGTNIVTGHLHSLRVTPYTDYRGTRFGVDSGTLADPGGPQFVAYTEDACVDWRSGFVVLTFLDGRLLWPEVVEVVGLGRISFRGEVLEV